MGKTFSPTIYETSAPDYDHHRRADSALAQGLFSRLQPNSGGRYLDIGCGSGNYTVALATQGIDIEGLDLSPSMLAKANAKAPNLRFTEGDMQALPFASSSFDGAICVNTLHYVRNSLVPTFQEMRRVLKRGATLVLFAVTLEQCLQYWVGRYFPFFWTLGKSALPSHDLLIDSLKQAGFSSVQSTPFFVTPTTADLFSYACKYRPHLILDPAIRAGTTPFQLPEYGDEIEQGCQLLKADIASGRIEEVIREHESGLGEGCFIAVKG